MKALSIAAALLAGSLSFGTAQAMPMGTINVQSNITTVDYACGRGWHLTRWGECRRNWRRPPPVAFTVARPAGAGSGVTGIGMVRAGAMSGVGIATGVGGMMTKGLA